MLLWLRLDFFTAKIKITRYRKMRILICLNQSLLSDHETIGKYGPEVRI